MFKNILNEIFLKSYLSGFVEHRTSFTANHLLLSYMYAVIGAVLLLDEPDAPLKILRQRQIYQILSDVALENNKQV